MSCAPRDDVDALGSQRLHHGQADAAAGAGDHGHLAFEFELHGHSFEIEQGPGCDAA